MFNPGIFALTFSILLLSSCLYLPFHTKAKQRWAIARLRSTRGKLLSHDSKYDQLICASANAWDHALKTGLKRHELH